MGVRGSGGTVRPAGPPYPGGHPDMPPGLGEWPAGDCGGGGPSQARAFGRPADLGRSAQRAAIRRAAALADGWIAGEPDAGTYPGAGAVAGRRDTQAGTAAARVPRGGLLARVHLGRGWACLGDGAAVSSLRAVEIPGCRTGEGAPRAASVAPGSRRAIGGRAACGNHLRRPGRGCRPRRRTRGHRPRRRATLHVHRAHALPRHEPPRSCARRPACLPRR
jgi:hypothetical protein